MTRNNTLNKVHVAVTTTTAVAEYKYVWRGNRTKSLSDLVQLWSWLKKLNCWKLRGHVPHSWWRQWPQTCLFRQWRV